jgi:hypothetical protein
MQKKHSRILFLCVVFALACLGIARYVAVRLSSLQLMNHAVLVAALDNQDDAYTSHYWLSDKDLLLFHALPSGKYTLVRHHLPDGKDYPLTALARLFNATGSCPNWSVISPDGKWLAWQGLESKADHTGLDSIVCFAQIDGSHYIQNRSNGGIPFWAIDSQHWIIVDRGGLLYLPPSLSFLLGNVEVPSLCHTVTVPSSRVATSGFLETISLPVQAIDLTQWEPHASLAHHLSLAGSAGQSDAVLEFQAIEDRLSAANHTVPLPYSTYVEQVVLAPDGKRLAWEIVSGHPPLLSSLMKWLPYKQPETDEGRNVLAIWEGNTDLSDVHEVGEMEWRRNAEPSNLQWLPGGNSLSFEYKKGLYIVKVRHR